MFWPDVERFGGLIDPRRELRRVNRMFSGLDSPSAGEFPLLNVWVTGDEAVVTTEIAGIDPGAVDISVVGSTLTLRGAREPVEAKEGGSYHRRERWHGRFSRTLELPFKVEAGKVSARCSRGVLRMTLPRAEAEKPKRIAIKSEQ